MIQQEIGVKMVHWFIQAIIHKGQMYCYEAGMRLNGCKTYQILEYENNYNTFEHLMLFCFDWEYGKACAV